MARGGYRLLRARKPILMILISVFLILDSSPVRGISNKEAMGRAPHAFSANLWRLKENPCLVCHAPHNDHPPAGKYRNGLPWNHQLCTNTYPVYSHYLGPTIDRAEVSLPDGTSKLCLSCHDGTIAVDSYEEHMSNLSLASGFSQKSSPPRGLRSSRKRPHPVSVAYDTNGSSKLNDPDLTAIGAVTIRDVLDNGKIQCSSCHEVHNKGTLPNSSLRAGLRGNKGNLTQFCLICHNM